MIKLRNLTKKFRKEESGAVMVLVAGALVILFAFAAVAIDFGLAYNSKAELQNAADAAALAGAQELPESNNAKSTAYKYANANGVPSSQTTVTTPYNNDSSMIEVVCTNTVEYYFAQVLGVNNIEVSSRAVAQSQSQWSGDALPYVNLDDDYTASNSIQIWEKSGRGNFESIFKTDYQIFNSNDPDTCYFQVDYMDGLKIRKGKYAAIKKQVAYIYKRVQPDQHVYVLSLSSEVMTSGKVLLTNGSKRKLSKLKNKDNIDPSQLVLLECIFDNFNYRKKILDLTVINEYDIMNGEYPPTYSGSAGGSVTMIE